jgi:tRNA(Arg) A34 adenosine deaminase TadA
MPRISSCRGSNSRLPRLSYRRTPPRSCERGGHILTAYPPSVDSVERVQTVQQNKDLNSHIQTTHCILHTASWVLVYFTMALSPLTPAQLNNAAAKCLALQASGQDTHGKRPFAALLLAPDNETQLMSSLSLSHVRHAECELARNAADNYSWDYLAGCTMVSTWEPCAMCAGTLYWAHIGRLVYLASEKTLQKLTGEGNTENLTLDLPCHRVFEAGQTRVEVVGPLVEEGWEEGG